jgi:hypothetical protein
MVRAAFSFAAAAASSGEYMPLVARRAYSFFHSGAALFQTLLRNIDIA